MNHQFLRCGVLFCAALASFSANAQQPTSVIWYTKPAAVWSEALPLGNGRLGAMVFGGANSGANNGDLEDEAKNKDIINGSNTRAQDEHLQVNESSLWQGARSDLLNPRGFEGFKKVRELLLASHGTDGSKIAEAEKLAAETMISNPRGMPGYSSLGDIYLRSTDSHPIARYRRELDLRTGLLKISYSQGGIQFTREAFASAPDQVIVLHLSAGRPGSISFALSMDRPADFSVRALDDRNLSLTQGPEHKDQIRFQGQVRVLAKGGSVKAANTSLAVNAADEVTLLFTAATDFKGGPFAGGSPAERCQKILDQAEKKPYSELRNEAAADVSHWMNRISLRLGRPDPRLESMPTDERLRRAAAGGHDLGLQTLYFDFARYLLVASSRPSGLPANLQGLWASGINNPWGSKYTINVNTEMNYWMAESANLGELHAPLFTLLDMVRTPGSGTGTEVANRYYGAHGFVIHHNTDIWGDAHPIDGVAYGIWPMGGAWLTLHAWDHYAYSNDRDFLATRAWPLLHDASLFFLDYLVKDDRGYLVTGPSLSPENKYKLSDGSTYSLTMGPTMDIEIVRELFERTLDAGGILKGNPAFLAQVKAAMDKLPPFKIGHLGNLQEWQQDYEDAAPGHRHISHLWALFPGTQITPEHTPDLAAAAQNALETRLRNGGGQTGWSRAWVVNYWDHLRDGDRAYESLQVLFRQSTFPNMMDTHPPGVFQIDGNLGGANGMVEALVQSRWYLDHAEVDLLPALPRAWPEGEIRGVKIRGGGELEMHWKGGKLSNVLWKCENSQSFVVRVPGGQRLVSIRTDIGSTAVPPAQDGSYLIPMTRGSSYQLGFD
jgi:alpha-L-fucosidase 2